MAINFPSAPVQGQVYEYGDYRYTWDGTKWTSVIKYGSSAVKIQSATPPAAPEPGLQWFDDSNGLTYIWHVNEGTSQGQWVEDAPQGLVDAVGDNILVTAAGSTTARTLTDREADIVNVKDFGAVGDGVTDDTAAFSGAGVGPTYVPAGSYEVSTGDYTGNIYFSFGTVTLTGGYSGLVIRDLLA